MTYLLSVHPRDPCRRYSLGEYWQILAKLGEYWQISANLGMILANLGESWKIFEMAWREIKTFP
jgi:hypothetical protein